MIKDQLAVSPFAIVPIEILADRRLGLWHIKVLIGLLSFRSKNTDTVFPSREALSERIGIHPSNISKTTTELVELGWLEKVGDGGYSKSSRYKILVPDCAANTLAESATEHLSKTVAESATVVETTTVAESTTRHVAESATRKEHTTLTDKEHTSKRSRATHLSQDWVPTDKDILFIASERPDLNARVTADDFRDYWTNVEGVKGRKLDWAATWRRWVRNARAGPNKQTPFKSFAEQKTEANKKRIAEMTGGQMGLNDADGDTNTIEGTYTAGTQSMALIAH